ncbi:MAG: hypothetical protein ACYS15_03600 [Planctomycetota bacterium]|jgi:hypothetical protein
MSRIGPGRLPIILTVLVTAPAAAQQTAVDLQPIDQSIEDVSVLSMSLRQIEPGLRQPNDFSRVYRVHGREDLYLRQQGGLYAVFPESVYAVNKEGQLRAVIPGGTTFYIGPPPILDPEPPPDEVPVKGLIQGRIDLRIDPHRESTVLAPIAPGRFDRSSTGQSIILGARMTLPPIVSDQEYRHRRVHGLMRRAVAGARGLPRTGAKGKRPLALEN